MSYTAYDDKRVALGQSVKIAAQITEVDANFVTVVEKRARALFALITKLGDELVGERPAAPKKQWSGGGGSNTPSVRSTLSKVSVDYFGDGKPIEFYDQRPAKASGKYSVKAPDFQSVQKFDLRGDGEEKNIPIWLVSADGTYNVEDAELLKRSGVDLSAPDSPNEAVAAVATAAAAPSQADLEAPF